MGDKKTAIKLFESKEIRTAWDSEKEEWYFSIVDTCAVLAETDRPRKYWNDLKKKLQVEGSELSEKIGQLKMPGADGKMRLTDVADTTQLLRLIQSIPSPKAEPFKQWLAMVGSQRLDETADPELAIQRALYNYKKKGYSDKWITQRLKSIEFRKELTDEWDRAGIKDLEYATCIYWWCKNRRRKGPYRHSISEDPAYCGPTYKRQALWSGLLLFRW